MVSTQHGPEASLEQIREDMIRLVIQPVIPAGLMDGETKIYVNPTGRFVVGGPQGDSGLTGRKIIVDTYGGSAPHGGGAFSGKDPTKVDRSAAYAARWVAKNVGGCRAGRRAARCSWPMPSGWPGRCRCGWDTFGTGTVEDSRLSRRWSGSLTCAPGAIIRDPGPAPPHLTASWPPTVTSAGTT